MKIIFKNNKFRISIITFYIDNLFYNLFYNLLNDKAKGYQ